MVKNLPANARDAGSIPGSGRSPGEGNGNLLQYSCLGNTTESGAWQATIHGVTRVRLNLGTKQSQPTKDAKGNSLGRKQKRRQPTKANPKQLLRTPAFLPGESPWTEKPGGLQSMRSQNVRQDWATKHSTAPFTTARTQKQPRRLSTEEQIKKTWYIYTMEYYLAIGRN